jgi:hypothetical protein
MAKKIMITEEQLKKVVSVVKEAKFDDALENYKKELNKQVSMSQDEAKLLITLGLNWCEGKDDHPDCDEVLRVRSKLHLY